MDQKILKKTRLARRAERKVSLLDAAIAVIAHKGLIGITMNDIAREAGCSYGVVAFHYKSKDGVLLAALDKLVEEYERIWKEHAAAGTGPAVQLRAMLDSDFDRRVGNRGRIAVWSAFWAEAPRNAAYRKRCAEVKKRYDTMTEDNVRQLASAEGLRLDATSIARGLNAMIDGFWIANRSPEPADLPIAWQRSERVCNICGRSFLMNHSLHPPTDVFGE
jgi:TetR/AcrR family transcriptional repressor of bet genes